MEAREEEGALNTQGREDGGMRGLNLTQRQLTAPSHEYETVECEMSSPFIQQLLSDVSKANSTLHLQVHAWSDTHQRLFN